MHASTWESYRGNEKNCRNAKPCVLVSSVLTSRYLSGICTYSLVVLTALKNYKIHSTATCRHHLIVKSFHWIQINVDLSELQHAEISVEHCRYEGQMAKTNNKKAVVTWMERVRILSGKAKQFPSTCCVLWLRNKCPKLYQFGQKNTQQKTFWQAHFFFFLRSVELLDN